MPDAFIVFDAATLTVKRTGTCQTGFVEQQAGADEIAVALGGFNTPDRVTVTVLEPFKCTITADGEASGVATATGWSM